MSKLTKNKKEILLKLFELRKKDFVLAYDLQKAISKRGLNVFIEITPLINMKLVLMKREGGPFYYKLSEKGIVTAYIIKQNEIEVDDLSFALYPINPESVLKYCNELHKARKAHLFHFRCPQRKFKEILKIKLL